MSQTVTRLRLPPELIGRVMDNLHLDDMLRASHVSRMWRAEARAHPTYCCKIRFDGGSAWGLALDSNIQFFRDRLSAKPGRPICLLMFLVMSLKISDQGIRDDVLPEINVRLQRLVTLTVVIYDRFVPDLFTALMGPAPELKSLNIEVRRETRQAVVQTLPLDLFLGFAPKLTELAVASFRLPPTPLSAFASVRIIRHELEVQTSGRELHPERFFINCPELQELYILANTRDMTRASWGACPPPQSANLRHLAITCVNDDSDTAIAVHALSHAAMVSVCVDTTDVDGETLGLMLSHLDNSPHLSLDITGKNSISLYCSVYDASRMRSRTFTHSLELDCGGFTRELIAMRIPSFIPKFATTAHRIVRLALSDHEVAWNFFLSLFPGTTLAGIETLSLTLCRETVLDINLDGAMRLPSLRYIELVGHYGDAELEVDEVAYLMGSMLRCAARRGVEMRLKGVTIVGDLRRIWGYFESITVAPRD